MTEDPIARVARDLAVRLHRTGPLAGSMSGSHVHFVTLPDGAQAVLKVTLARDGQERASAERELRFYLDVRQRTPVRTPDLLDHLRADDTVALLLTAHPTPLAATDWTEAHWLTLAEDLADLHQTPVPDDAARPEGSWISEALHNPDLEVTRAFWCGPGEPELLARLLDDAAALDEAISRPERCLTHGDCHTDNLLVEDDRLVWTDWQAVGIGDPAADLAFVSARATPSGAVPPLADMLDVYARRRRLDVAPLGRAVLAAELAILLLGWPHYAAYNDEPGIDRVRRRTRLLGRTWLAG